MLLFVLLPWGHWRVVGEGAGIDGGCGRPRGNSYPGTGGSRSAPKLHTHSHTHSRAHTHAPPPPSRAPPAARRSVWGGVGAPPLPEGPPQPARARARRPARPTTCLRPPLRPRRDCCGEATSLARAAPPSLHLSGQRSPPGANRYTQGAGSASLLLKVTCSSTTPARGQLSRRRARARSPRAAGSQHAAEQRCSLHGDCGMRGAGETREEC